MVLSMTDADKLNTRRAYFALFGKEMIEDINDDTGNKSLMDKLLKEVITSQRTNNGDAAELADKLA